MKRISSDQKIAIIGINEDGISGLSKKAIDQIKSADIIVGGKRHINLVSQILSQSQKIVYIGANISSTLYEIESYIKEGKRIVVLNSGDPLFFGFSKNLFERFGKDIFEVIPNLSSLQLAFAKIKETWDDAKIISIHSKAFSLDDFFWDIVENEKIFILTSGKDDPKKIAEFLEKNNISVKKFFVLENLGGENERVLELNTKDVSKYDFSPLNVVIILKDKKERVFHIGEEDENFTSKEGLITKSEIRAIVLSKLCLKENSVVWDIGGGSGSVSIECALIARKGKVYCIEKRKDLIDIIKENTEKFKAKNLVIVHGEAPQILENLEDPDSVFIGGGGEKIEDIIEECLKREKLKNLVATFVVPSHFIRAKEFLEKKGFNPECLFINAMKLKKIDRFEKFEEKTNVFLLNVKIK
jgi:precorrin-6Y C5,15-methyltransferase (decarboxylating)